VIIRLNAEDVLVTDGKLDRAVNDIGSTRLSDLINVSDLRDGVCNQVEHQKRAFFEENGIGKCLFIGTEIGGKNIGEGMNFLSKNPIFVNPFDGIGVTVPSIIPLNFSGLEKGRIILQESHSSENHALPSAKQSAPEGPPLTRNPSDIFSFFISSFALA
jgi:hypothetical protein